MSEHNTPFDAMFEMQRQTINQSREFLHQSVELGKQTNRIALESIESNRSVQSKGTEVAHTVMSATLDSMAATMPGSDAMMRNMRTVVDDQFDAADEVNAEFWEAMHDVLEENIDVYDSMADQYLAAVDDTCDEAIEMLSTFEHEMGGARLQTSE